MTGRIQVGKNHDEIAAGRAVESLGHADNHDRAPNAFDPPIAYPIPQPGSTAGRLAPSRSVLDVAVADEGNDWILGDDILDAGSSADDPRAAAVDALMSDDNETHGGGSLVGPDVLRSDPTVFDDDEELPE